MSIRIGSDPGTGAPDEAAAVPVAEAPTGSVRGAPPDAAAGVPGADGLSAPTAGAGGVEVGAPADGDDGDSLVLTGRTYRGDPGGLRWRSPSPPSRCGPPPVGRPPRDGATERSTVPRLTVGETAPDFTLPTADGGTLALADLRGRPVIVYFYPAAMTPGCTTQACDFRDNLASLAAAGYAVVGVSPDPVDRLAAFVEQEGLTFPLVSDADHAVMEAWGAWGEKTLYGKKVTGVVRSTVVLDAEGRVVLAQYNVKATGHVAKLRRDLAVA